MRALGHRHPLQDPDGRDARLEVEVRVAWFERDRMLKLAVPTTLDGGDVRARRPTASRSCSARGEETVGHRWMALLSPDGRRALTLVNDTTYGFDVADGELRVSLLRAPAYAGHPVDDVTPIVRQDRFEPREDQGEHVFRFWLDAGPGARPPRGDRSRGRDSHRGHDGAVRVPVRRRARRRCPASCSTTTSSGSAR